MAIKPQGFLRFHCSSTNALCATCPREFALTSSAIEAIVKTQAGGAILVVSGLPFAVHPKCQERSRYIETAIPYEDVLDIFNGDIFDFGEVTMTEKEKFSD